MNGFTFEVVGWPKRWLAEKVGVHVTTALVLRLLSRRITKVALSWDDSLAIGAYLFASGWNGVLLRWTHDGFGMHLVDALQPPEQVARNAKRDLYFDELCYASSLACSKLAILLFYWRLSRNSSIKIPIILLAISSLVWLILRTFMAIFHCVPIAAFWDRAAYPSAICAIDDSKFFIGTVLVHLLLDLAIMVLPILQIRKLQLGTARKVGVAALFLFGIFVCAASVAVITESYFYDSSTAEMSWDIASIFIWATVEVNLAVVSACLPMLRPIFTAVGRWARPSRTRGGRGRYGGDAGHHPRPQMPSKQSSLGKFSLSRSGGKSRAMTESGLAYTVTRDDEDRIMDGLTGRQVIITGNHQDESMLGQGGMPLAAMGGIMVRKDIGVHISRAGSPD